MIHYQYRIVVHPTTLMNYSSSRIDSHHQSKNNNNHCIQLLAIKQVGQQKLSRRVFRILRNFVVFGILPYLLLLLLFLSLSNYIIFIDGGSAANTSTRSIVRHYHQHHKRTSCILSFAFFGQAIPKHRWISHKHMGETRKENYTFVSGTTSVTTGIKMVQQVREIAKDAFKDKVILVTGASGGLGSAFAQTLCECNPAALILSSRKEPPLMDVVKACQKINNKVQYDIILCDLMDPINVQKLISTVFQKYPQGIDVLINNGGVSSRSKFLDTSLAIDQRVMQVNFFAGVALAKAFIPKMIEKPTTSGTTKGRVIWISSVQGLVGLPYRTSYASSKFAVQGYCEALRAELYTSDIAVHCVSPGYIRTNLSKSALTGDGQPSGVMDATTAAGADPHDVSIEILNKVSAGYTDFIVAANFQAILAIYVRLLCPALLRNSLVKRFIKQQEQEKRQQEISSSKKDN